MSEYPQSETAMLLRIAQLEEALRFYADERNYEDLAYVTRHIGDGVMVPSTSVLVDDGERARAALSSEPSEAPASKPWGPAMLQDKERCVHTYSEGPGAPWQRCALKKDHYGWHAWGEASEATRSEKEGEDG